MAKQQRALDNVTPEQAAQNGWKVVAGESNAWETVAKACNDQIGIMKSTKRMRVPGGFLYQVSTEGPRGYAEAVTFVPFNEVLKAQKPQVKKPPMIMG